MPRKSKYLVPDDIFINAVKESFSIAEALRKMGFPSVFGGAYKVFKLRVRALQLDTSHFTGQGHLKGRTHNWTASKLSITEILIDNSEKTLTYAHKKRIFEAGLLKNECYECHLGPEWQNKPITLQIDHINGNCFDHRIENLRILCPNCHSQTDNYGAKNKKGRSTRQNQKEKRVVVEKILIVYQCILCKNKCNAGSTYCIDCWRTKRKELRTYTSPEKIVWPSLEELLHRLETTSFVQLGKELGISDNAIRKRIKRLRKEKEEAAIKIQADDKVA